MDRSLQSDLSIQERFEDISRIRIRIPLDYYYMGEDMACKSCKEEGYIYGFVEPNGNGGYSGEFLCTKCGFTWSKL